MSLHLDARQRAILMEMGVRVAPSPPTREQRPQSTQTTPTKRVAAAVSAVQPQALTTEQPKVVKGAHDHLDWPALKARAAGCFDCPLGQSRQSSVWGTFLNTPDDDTATKSIDLLIITDPPDDAAQSAGHPLGQPDGAASQLVANMVRAMGRSLMGSSATDPRVFLTNITKCRLPNGERLDDAHIQACRHYIDRAIDLLHPRLILAFGRAAGQMLMTDSSAAAAPSPVGRLRGTVRAYRGTPWVATFTPQYLLRNPLEKAKAWEDCCLGLSALSDHTGAPTH